MARSLNIPIVGVGGIRTGRDALEFLVVGASAVQVGTANFTRSDTTIRIVEEMEAYLKEKGITSVSSMIRTLSVPARVS